MYNLLYDFVNHVWQNTTGSSSTEQQIYLYGAIAMGLLLTVVLSDGIISIFKNIFRGRR